MINIQDFSLKTIPKNPGIYKFMDKNNKIIYIGKSVNLFSRVNSYFNGKSKLSFAKKNMVKQIKNIETILTNTETESLILETTLIKKHKPKYNILMKDDKNHIYIKITNELIPRIIKTRIKKITYSPHTSGTKLAPATTRVSLKYKGRLIKEEYFGPYISTGKVNNILKIIKKLFGYRSCNIKFEEDEKKQIFMSNIGNTKIPCMDYYIGRCAGPCLLKDKYIKVYLDKIDEIKSFLKGNFIEVQKSLENKMKEYAKSLQFEEAEKIKKDIESIKILEENQIVRDKIKGNFDIINYIEKFDKFFIGLIEVRDSKISNFNNYEIENKLEENKAKIIKTFLERRVVENNTRGTTKQDKALGDIKDITYIIPENLDILSGNNNIEIPKIGGKLDLLKLCYKNIYEYAYKKHLSSLSTKGFTKKNMLNILDILGYKQINKNIMFECNDISHLSGTHSVASRSIIENGKSNTSKYKRFNIKTLKELEINDFASMKEIMIRRLKEIEKTNIFPDLIIIDGGKGQLSSVINIIQSYKTNKYSNNNLTPNIIKIPIKKEILNKNKIQIVSIAKREEELFIIDPHPNISPSQEEGKICNFKKIILDKSSTELKLIQKIRDEAHRFAITFNREKRIKASKVNILESLPGFGPKTRTKLLKKYGNIEALIKIDKKELKNIINIQQIQTLEDHGII